MAVKKQHMARSLRTNFISWSRKFGMHSTWMYAERCCSCWWVQKKWSNHEFSAGATETLPGWEKPHAKTVAWSYDMEGHAKNALRDTANWRTKRPSSYTKFQGWSSVQEGGARINCRIARSMLENCVEMLVFGTNCQTWHSVVSQQTCPVSRQMDSGLWQRFGKIINSYIHHKSDCRQYCHVGNTAQQCRLGLFQDSDVAGDLEDSKSTSGGILCLFGSRASVPISWMCRKRTSASHSSTESEIMSLDT